MIGYVSAQDTVQFTKKLISVEGIHSLVVKFG